MSHVNFALLRNALSHVWCVGGGGGGGWGDVRRGGGRVGGEEGVRSGREDGLDQRQDSRADAPQPRAHAIGADDREPRRRSARRPRRSRAAARSPEDGGRRRARALQLSEQQNFRRPTRTTAFAIGERRSGRSQATGTDAGAPPSACECRGDEALVRAGVAPGVWRLCFAARNGPTRTRPIRMTTRVNEGCIAAAGPRARTHAFWESARHDLGDSSRRSLVLSPRSERQREPLRGPDLASRRARRPLARTPISGKRRPQKQQCALQRRDDWNAHRPS